LESALYHLEVVSTVPISWDPMGVYPFCSVPLSLLLTTIQNRIKKIFGESLSRPSSCSICPVLPLFVHQEMLQHRDSFDSSNMSIADLGAFNAKSSSDPEKSDFYSPKKFVKSSISSTHFQTEPESQLAPPHRGTCPLRAIQVITSYEQFQSIVRPTFSTHLTILTLTFLLFRSMNLKPS
jgi:hypothetical protein